MRLRNRWLRCGIGNDVQEMRIWKKSVRWNSLSNRRDAILKVMAETRFQELSPRCGRKRKAKMRFEERWPRCDLKSGGLHAFSETMPTMRSWK